MSNPQQNMPSPVVMTTPAGKSLQIWDFFIPTLFASGSLSSADGTNTQDIIVAGSDEYVFIQGIQMTVDAVCTVAAAGMTSIVLESYDPATLTATNIAVLRVYIPAAAATPSVPTVIRETSANGNFWATPSVGNTIRCHMSGKALTAGQVRVSFNYGKTTYPIGNNQ